MASSSRHNHAPWRKAILVPFWVIQMLFLCIMVGLLSLALGVLAAWNSKNNKDVNNALKDLNDDERKKVNQAINIIIPVWFVICTYSLLATIAEIVLLALHKLKPVVFLVLSGSKTLIWTTMLVLNIVSIATVKGSGGGFVSNIILTLSFWVPFVYGCIVFFRQRKSNARNGTNTTLPNNPSYPAQYKNLADEQHDEESAPLAGARPRGLSNNHTNDTRYEPFRGGDRSVSPNPGMQVQDNLIAARPSSLPTFNVQHNGPDTYEMGNTKNGNVIR